MIVRLSILVIQNDLFVAQHNQARLPCPAINPHPLAAPLLSALRRYLILPIEILDARGQAQYFGQYR